MFFLPAAIFAEVPGIGWGDALHNWLFALLGNFVGAAVFVAGAYWWLYGRVVRDPPPPADEMRSDGDGALADADGDGDGDGRLRRRVPTSRSAA